MTTLLEQTYSEAPRTRTYELSFPAEIKKVPKPFHDDSAIVEMVPPTYDIKELINSKLMAHKMEDAFFIADIGQIIRKYREWKELLPNVLPFYAVKCNPKLAILKTLADLGANFDCASMREIQAVLSLGVSPDRIIYANACKQNTHLRYAQSVGVTRMTFDNEYELYKIKANHPEARLLLRIKTDDSSSICQLSSKFGAVITDTPGLLRAAKSLGLNVVGVSFHVGSGCLDPKAYEQSLINAKFVFDQASDIGFEMDTLDIGGGFPGSTVGKISFPKIASVIAPALAKYFPKTNIIAEPGRYFVAASHTLVTNVIAKREITTESTLEITRRLGDLSTKNADKFLFYVNDGVYGSFNNIIYDHATPLPLPLTERSSITHYCTMFGPTCDGLDTLVKNISFPELHVGDWIYWPDMGAYTVAASSMFNGFDLTPVFYVNSEEPI